MTDNEIIKDYKKKIMAVHDAMDVLNGKWTIHIIAVLCYRNKMRFSEILREINGISNKMLSKELRVLEINKLVIRTVYDRQPITVDYQLSEYGKKLLCVINNLSDWGIEHRKEIIGE